MTLAMRTDVIDQALDMALHPASDCLVSIASASMILCLAQSPKAHSYIVRKEVVEKMLKMCELKHKMINEQSSQSHQGKKENPMAVIALKYVILPDSFLFFAPPQPTHPPTHPLPSPPHTQYTHVIFDPRVASDSLMRLYNKDRERTEHCLNNTDVNIDRKYNTE